MARYRIPVDEARRLYDRLGSWERVAQVLKRPNGQPFKSFSIQAAVRWADMGNAGTAYRASMNPDDDEASCQSALSSTIEPTASYQFRCRADSGRARQNLRGNDD